MPAVPFKVKAVFEYASEEPDDLKFPNGQIITVIDDQDEDWYTGEYISAAGDKLEGMFPRNFVEKYEPSIPSRPARTPKRTAAPEPLPEPAATHSEPAAPQPPEPLKEAEIQAPHDSAQPPPPAGEPDAASSLPPAPQPAAALPAFTKSASPPSTTSSKPGPPPVAEKPASSSFRDRIAAFNMPAAAPIAPFKPGGQVASSGFIKKPFVAPPPSKNSYVPPPREPPPQKIYRREEDITIQHEEEREAPQPSRPTDDDPDDQPKPTSLKERIALLQKQQLEQAQRHADSAQKKDKPKKPPKKRLEPVEEPEPAAQEDHLERLDTNETVGKKTMEAPEDDTESLKSPPVRQASINIPTPLPPRELVSDTNDADDSGAGDTEDAPGSSTEEDRPRSKGNATVGGVEPVPPKEAAPESDKEEGEEGDEEETEEEEEEDPEVRRKRELRDRMARLGGGVGMMGMFGPPGGMPGAGPPRKSRQSTEGPRQSSEQHKQEEMARAPPVPILALPGMSNQIPKRTEEPVEAESDEDETAHVTPQDLPREVDATDDYIAQPPKRSSTEYSAASGPHERTAPPPPPREVRAPPPPPPSEARAFPPPPRSPTARAVPPPPPPPVKVSAETAEGSEEDDDLQSTQRSGDGLGSPTSAPAIPALKNRPEPAKPPPLHRDAPQSPQTRAPPPPPPPPGLPPNRRSTSDSHGAIGARPQEDEDSEAEVTEYDGDYDTDIASSAKHKDALKSHNRDSSIDEGMMTDDAAKSPSSPPARAVPPLPPVAAPRDIPPPPPPGAPKFRKSTDVPRVPPPVPLPTQPSVDDEDYDPYRYSAPQHGIPSPSIQAPRGPILSSPREELEEDDMYGASAKPPRIPPPPPSEKAVLPPPPISALPEPAKQSMELNRPKNLPRRSMDQQRPSGEHGSIASDLDLGRSSFWWTQENLLPPALQQRNDLLFEMESSTASKRGGKPMVSKAIYVLYQDYSQTTITATFDSSDPSHVTLEQAHERPPPIPRKDQLESASEQFGARIAAAASNAEKSGSTLGDGSPSGLILELLRPLEGALKPISTRAYGALVYANLANASTQQFDEIRPGDIATFRNAKFSGHKGGLHQKYTQEAGKPDHVAIVIDWDGTKKKIRAWEQVSGEDRGKGKKSKVKEESFKVGDLRSGEVRVWRVMGRNWVGWDKS